MLQASPHQPAPRRIQQCIARIPPQLSKLDKERVILCNLLTCCKQCLPVDKAKIIVAQFDTNKTTQRIG